MGPGDVCEVEISGVGTLRNRVITEAAAAGGDFLHTRIT
jgi:hypothetical protein